MRIAIAGLVHDSELGEICALDGDLNLVDRDNPVLWKVGRQGGYIPRYVRWKIKHTYDLVTRLPT
ncbi:hypothetical protein DHEL01_v212924 [Diaporthe helianthi]|uniref:Uncharacterized protein n=1 Tax=Diaporthe helianthi TaxID=158607 RepID=A0A2P5HEJ8_DIAHE|nr:hypothetical protein DHEL01_v212924 [Diaporthe helianthi]